MLQVYWEHSVKPILRILGFMLAIAVGFDLGGFFTAFLFGLVYHVVTKPIEE